MDGASRQRFRQVDELFDAALDVPPDERDAFIARTCGGDAVLGDRVIALLRAHERSSGFLQTPAAELAAVLLEDLPPSAPAPPVRAGPFRIVRELGHGGMGVVYLAEREGAEFAQRVALKLVRHLGPAEDVRRRFVEERRILALLEHPRIAHFIDGGLTSDGVPYFAMELVEGERIDAYCDGRKLSIDQRLDLFIGVCEAVQYAHEHLVIHRDLKPSNILVRGDGQLKLLDFGIAKLLDPLQGADGDTTETGAIALTPEYAAPEQVRDLPISTATDVYSLGVLLYVLLTGERPYDVRGKSRAEIDRIVCVDVPPGPSTTAPASLRRRLRGDLDLIVMTALQKQRERRYQSPAALAEDLRRFRHGHAILARPDSTRYRLTKFVGRHRAGVAIASVAVLGLVGGASRERVLRSRAEVQARKATEVERFLVSVFDVVDPNAWTRPDGGKVTARELLERGASRVDSILIEEPEVQAELRTVLGRVYTNLGLYDKAMPLLQRSLAQRTLLYGPVDTRVAATMDLLGSALTKLDKYDEAEPLLRQAIEQRRRLLGNTHTATAEAIDHLATLLEQRNKFADAEPLYREVLAIREKLLGDSAVETAHSRNNLGLILYRQGAYAPAESLYRRALAIKLQRLGEDHASTATTMQNLAQTLQFLTRFEEAETFQRSALAAKRKALGDAHPSVTISLNNLANLLTRELGRLDEGEALAREALALDRRIFGENHSYVAASLANVGVILRLKGDFVAADTLLRQALAINRRLLGEPHARVASDLSNLGQTRFLMGDGAGAIELIRQSLAQHRAAVGESHLNTIGSTALLGSYLAQFGDPAEAESLSRAASSRLDPEKREHRTLIIISQVGLGKALLAQRRTDEALAVLERVVELARKHLGDGHFRTGDALLTYGNALVAKERHADAEPVLRAALAALEKSRRGQPRLAAQAVAAVAKLPR